MQSKLEELAHVRETLEATMIQHQKGAVIAQEAWESEQRRFEGENVRLSGEAASLLVFIPCLLLSQHDIILSKC